MKKLCIAYANCQGDGLAHFLRKVPEFNEAYEIRVWHNWQIIMGESDPAGLNADAAKADIFIYQHTPSLKYGSLSSEDMVANLIPKSCQHICISYAWNTGFFPIVQHGCWWTGDDVIARARAGEDIKAHFEQDPLSMRYDCARRFAENLAEQGRREAVCDIKMVPWILENYRKAHLFLLCNHPASPLLVAWAREILRKINPAWDQDIPIASANEANLPGFHWLHPAVIWELHLEYSIEEGDRTPFPFWMGELMKKPFEP